MTEVKFASGKRFGNYEIVEEIARGGMGIIYRARQVGVDREVALKVIQPGKVDENFLQRFFREAKTTGALNHPNIVRIFGMGKEGGTYYLAMEFIHGCSLTDYLKKTDVSLDQKIQIFTKACEALRHAHQHKILHRDLKPDNILVNNSGEPFLADFGLAKNLDSNSALTQTDVILGTPFYMSPEQIKGEDVDLASDVFSMGVILYQILTGQLPFYSKQWPDLCKLVIHQHPKPVRQYNSQVSKSLEFICHRALEKDTSKRYSTAKYLARDLQKALRGEKVSGDTLRITNHRLSYQFQSKKQQFVAIAILLFIVSISVVVWQYQQYRTQKFTIQETEIRSLCQEAEDLVQQNFPKRAIKKLQGGIKKYPYPWQIYLTLGKIYQQYNYIETTQKSLLKAYEIAPSNRQVLLALGKFYHTQNQSSKGLEYINQYVQKYPESAKGYRSRAMLYQKLQVYEAYQKDQKMAETIENKLLKPELKKLGKMQDIHETQNFLTQLIEKFPYQHELLQKRANIYHQKGKAYQALEDIARAIEIQPEYEYFQQKAEWLYQQKYYEEALATYQILLSNAPSTTAKDEILFQIGRTYEQLKDFHQAYLYFSKIISPSTDKKLYFWIARACIVTKKYSIAEDYIKKSFTSESLNEQEQGDLHYYEGILREEENQIEKAVALWQQAISKKSHLTGEANFRVGKYLFNVGKRKQASSFFRNAAELLPDNTEVLSLTGKNFQSLEKWKLAIEYFSKAISLEPWNYDYLYNRGSCYIKVQDLTKAQSDFGSCHQIRPKELAPVAELFEILLKDEGGIIHNITALSWTWGVFYRLANQDFTFSPSLFDREHKTLSRKYWEEYQLAEKNLPKTNEHSLVQVKIYLQGFLHSHSPAVRNMASQGIITLYYDQAVRQLLANALDSEVNEIKKNRLTKLHEEVLEAFYERLMIYFRHLLFRYYHQNDLQALKNIFAEKNEGIQTLTRILQSNKEEIATRFLAARALYDLKTVKARQELENYAQSGDKVTNFLVQLAQQKYSQLEGFYHPSAYLRSLMAKYCPMNKEMEKAWISDEDSRVVLFAIEKVVSQNPKSLASTLLLTLMRHKEEKIRCFAHSIYWNQHIRRGVLTREGKKHLQMLVQGTRDTSAKVRLIALAFLGRLDIDKFVRIFKEHLDTNDPLIFLQVLSAFKKDRKYFPLIKKIALNRDLALIFQVITRISLMEDRRGFLPIIMQDLKSNNLQLRFFSLFLCGAAGSDLLAGLALKHLDSDIPFVQAGSLLSYTKMSKKLVQKNFAQIAELSKSDKPYVKAIAFYAILYTNKKYSLPGFDTWFLQAQKSSTLVRQGSAEGLYRFAYNWMKGAEGFKMETLSAELWFWKVSQEILHYPKKHSKNFREHYFTAIQALEMFLLLTPEESKGDFSLGCLHYALGEFDIAARYLHTAIKKDKKLLYSYWLAQTYLQQEHYQQAWDLSCEVAKSWPWKLELCNLQIEIAQRLGKKNLVDDLTKRKELLLQESTSHKI